MISSNIKKIHKLIMAGVHSYITESDQWISLYIQIPFQPSLEELFLLATVIEINPNLNMHVSHMIWRWGLFSVHDVTVNFHLCRIGCLMNHQKAYKRNENLDHHATSHRQPKISTYCIIQCLSISKWDESYRIISRLILHQQIAQFSMSCLVIRQAWGQVSKLW